MKIFGVICALVFVASAAAQQTPLVYKHREPLKPAKPLTVVLLHGYGSNEDDLLSVGTHLPRNAELVALRAPVPTNNGGYCWFPLDFLPEQKFRYDYARAADASRKIASTIRQLCRENVIDSNDVVLLGFSQGAIISYDVALRYPTLVKRVVALSGGMMDGTKNIPATETNTTAYFIGHGLRDNVVAHSDSEKAVAFLKSRKAHVIFNSYPAGHHITGAMIRDISLWLKATLGG